MLGTMFSRKKIVDGNVSTLSIMELKFIKRSENFQFLLYLFKITSSQGPFLMILASILYHPLYKKVSRKYFI